MRNLITGIAFFVALYFVWNQSGTERSAASLSTSPSGMQWIQTASIGGWQDTAPKARPFEPTEQIEKVSEASTVYAGMSPMDAAKSYLEAHRQEWNLQSHHDISPSMTQTPMGSSVRFQFSQDGTPITGMYVSIQMGANNEILSVENLYRPLEVADLKADMLSTQDLSEKISQRFQMDRDEEPNLLLYAGSQSTKAEAVYSMPATEVANNGTTRRPVKLLVRASDGQILDVTYERSEF